MTDKNFDLPSDQSNEPESDFLTDQTQFGLEKPLFEKNTVHPINRPQTTQDQPQPRWYQKPINLVLLAVLAIFLLLVSLLVMTMPRTAPLLTTEPSPSPTTNSINDPLRQKIRQLRTELQAADPNRQEYPFPPVNMNLALPEQE